MGGQRIGYAYFFSLSLSLSVTLSKARAFVATTTARAGPFFYLWCSLFFSPKMCLPRREKTTSKRKKENSTEGRETREGTNRINHNQSSVD